MAERLSSQIIRLADSGMSTQQIARAMRLPARRVLSILLHALDAEACSSRRVAAVVDRQLRPQDLDAPRRGNGRVSMRWPLPAYSELMGRAVPERDSAGNNRLDHVEVLGWRTVRER